MAKEISLKDAKKLEKSTKKSKIHKEKCKPNKKKDKQDKTKKKNYEKRKLGSKSTKKPKTCKKTSLIVTEEKETPKIELATLSDLTKIELDTLSDSTREAIKYILEWKNSKQNIGIWKFKKNIQNWIIRSVLSEEILPIHFYNIALEYVCSIPKENSLLKLIVSEIEKKKTSNTDLTNRESLLLSKLHF